MADKPVWNPGPFIYVHDGDQAGTRYKVMQSASEGYLGVIYRHPNPRHRSKPWMIEGKETVLGRGGFASRDRAAGALLINRRTEESAAALWMVGWVVTFKDGAEPLSDVIHVGTKAECEKIYENMPALTYPGKNEPDECKAVVQVVPPHILELIKNAEDLEKAKKTLIYVPGSGGANVGLT